MWRKELELSSIREKKEKNELFAKLKRSGVQFFSSLYIVLYYSYYIIILLLLYYYYYIIILLLLYYYYYIITYRFAVGDAGAGVETIPPDEELSFSQAHLITRTIRRLFCCFGDPFRQLFVLWWMLII